MACGVLLGPQALLWLEGEGVSGTAPPSPAAVPGTVPTAPPSLPFPGRVAEVQFFRNGDFSLGKNGFQVHEKQPPSRALS